MGVRNIVLLVAAAACCGGCGRVHSLHYLKGDFAVGPQRGFRLEKVYAAPDAASILDRTLIVHVEDPARTIQVDASKIHPDLKWPAWRFDFESCAANQAWIASVFGDVCAAGDKHPIDRPDLTLQLAVTEWHEGQGWLRLLLGFGLGATRVQWEGAILEAGSDRVLFAFADARAHPGGPSFMGLGAPVMRGPALIAKDLKWALADLRHDLRTLGAADRPELESYESRPLYRRKRTD